SVEVDARSGGRYRYTMVDDDTGERVTTGGVYRLVEFCELLEFTWGHVDGDPEEQPLVIVELEPARHGTRMSFELRGVDGVEGDGSYYDGWVSALNSLEGYLARASA
ncbi:MAG: SRPBCC domain-containing protein, partial [Actinobacteria bacterium]|nr:SRPBCC domain-containing protein [Actinomycetota bacterium]